MEAEVLAVSRLKDYLTVLLVTLLVTLSGCGADQHTVGVAPDEPEQGTGNRSVSAVRLVFEEQEAGIQPYRTRYLISSEYVRIDDGADTVDFILLDRRTQTIYSASAESRTILTIMHRIRDAESPLVLELAEKRQPLEAAPTIAGRRAEHRTYLVNGTRCYDVVAVPGLADDAVAALRLYRLVLASEHKRILPHVPADTHEACDLAHNVFAPDRHLRHGLPIQEWDQVGYRRALLDMDVDYQADPVLFILPEGFRRHSMDVHSGDGA